MYHDVAVEVGGQRKPQDVWSTEPGRHHVLALCAQDVPVNGHVEEYDVDESQQRAFEVEERDAPKKVEQQLQEEGAGHAVTEIKARTVPYQSERDTQEKVNQSPRVREYPVGRSQARLVQCRIPVSECVRLKVVCRCAHCEADGYGDEDEEESFHDVFSFEG